MVELFEDLKEDFDSTVDEEDVLEEWEDGGSSGVYKDHDKIYSRVMASDEEYDCMVFCDSDFDGTSAAALYDYVYESVLVFPMVADWQFSKWFPKFDNLMDDDVPFFILDFPPDNEEGKVEWLEMLDGVERELVIRDHHEGYDGRLADVVSDSIIRPSAPSVMRMVFEEDVDTDVGSDVEELVDIVDVIDSGDRKHPQYVEWQSLRDVSHKKCVDEYVELVSEHGFELLEEVDDPEVDRCISLSYEEVRYTLEEWSFCGECEGVNYCVAYGDPNPDLVAWYAFREWDVDTVIVVKMSGSVSCRGDFALELAEQFNGGGHERASGCDVIDMGIEGFDELGMEEQFGIVEGEITEKIEEGLRKVLESDEGDSLWIGSDLS